MKKILIGLVALLLIAAGSLYFWYQASYGGTSYYTIIKIDGKKISEQADNGETFYRYYYDQDAADANGNVKKIEFTGDHNLRKTAILKLTYNNSKGVTNWEEVNKTDVPEKALQKIE